MNDLHSITQDLAYIYVRLDYDNKNPHTQHMGECMCKLINALEIYNKWERENR